LAIFYDFFEVVGGAEQFTIELANNTKQSIIVSGFNNEIKDKLPEITVNCHVLDSLSSIPIWKSIKAMKAFKTVNPNLLKDEINLFSGNNAPLAVYNSQANKNYYYCHTPPRFAYDLFDYYQQELSWYQKKMVKLFAYYVRYEYESALRKMDAIFCNSVNVQKRIKKHLGYDAEVIYPPVNVNKYYNNPSKGYYLSTARLENYKRVELIVKAFFENTR
jgi:glycosyltransferase involved in cell wall biosynthesis